jgi:hypothetical protein
MLDLFEEYRAHAPKFSSKCFLNFRSMETIAKDATFGPQSGDEIVHH